MATETPKHPQEPLLPRVSALVVHADTACLDFYRDTLEGFGLKVLAVDTCVRGLALLGREKFRLIVVSQGSPAFEGRVILERAMEIDPHTLVLVVTRNLDMRSYLEAMQLGASDYLEEPVPVTEIVRLVKTHMAAFREGSETRAARQVTPDGSVVLTG